MSGSRTAFVREVIEQPRLMRLEPSLFLTKEISLRFASAPTFERVAVIGVVGDVAGVVLLACTQSARSRIIEVQMRTMAESLA